MPTPLDILYPNGQVEAVQVYIWDGTKPVLWDGSVSGAVGGASGVAIQDGVTSTTKATVVASPYDSSKNSLVVSDGISRLSAHFDGMVAYSNQIIAAAPGAGFAIVIDNVISSASSSTTANSFYLDDSDANRVFGAIYMPAVAGTGFCSGPIHKRITANKALRLTSSANIPQSFDIDYHIEKV